MLTGVLVAMAALPPISIAEMQAGLQPPTVAYPGEPLRQITSAADNRWALVIGVGKFRGRTKPNPGSAGDALDVKELLLRAGWADDHIRLLVDSDATGTAIREGLGWLADRCRRSSSCVFHYSGHVKQYRASDGDAEAVDEALWGHDNAFIPDGEVAGHLRRLPNAWINISGCEAAGFDDGVSAPYRLFTASSKEVEKSYEHPQWKNSIFTGLMVDQGILQGGADTNRDGQVTRSEAVEFSFDSAAEITRGQKKGAQHPYIAGGEGGDWLLPHISGFRAVPKIRPVWPACAMGLACHWSGRAGNFIIP